MAFASVGSRGTATAKTAGGSITISPSSNVSAGALLVMFVAWDSSYNPSFPSAEIDKRWNITDSVGNIWCAVHALSGSPSGGHCMSGIYVTRVRTTITTSDTITVRDQDTTQVAKAIELWEFSYEDAGKRWATARSGPVGADTTSADPASVTISSLDSQEYLLLHVLAGEGPQTDSYTWDSDYTQITGAGTTGGADDSNVHLRGGYRIATLTSDTVDVSSDTADRDYIQGLVALCEVDHDPVFPNQPVIDNFNRADENPIDGGLWSTATCVPTTSNKARIVSNQAAGQSGGHGGQWLLGTLNGEVEVYASIPTFGTSGANGLGILMHGSGCGNLATRAGFEADWRQATFDSSDRDFISMGDAGNVSGVTAPKLVTWRDCVAGNKIGMRRLGKTNHLWIDEGSGWEWCGAAYYNGGGDPISGLFGFEIFDGTTRMDDFGGGVYVPPFMGQIIRRVLG